VPNPLLLFSAQIIAIISVLLLAVGGIKTEPKAASARVFALMAVFIVFYLLGGMTGTNIDPQFRLDLANWELTFAVGSNAVSGLFMIYCFLVFQEQQRFPTSLGLVFVIQVIVDLILSALSLYGEGASDSSTVQVMSTAMDIMMLAFVGFAIYWTIKGWRADLVDDRRVFRWFIIGVQGALIFIVIFVENFLIQSDSGSYASAQFLLVSSIAFLALGMVLVAMRFDLVSLNAVIRRVTELNEEPETGETKPFDIDSFNKAFRDAHLYREAGLTIAGLAKKLSMPEYKLRAFIHKQLGFRNFNAMLHKYRIEDASRALQDKESQSLPVLTIALSVGYQSITPFNNAFRQIMGVTPSEYRKQSMQD
jgi:AraC-like DNA-binding protein